MTRVEKFHRYREEIAHMKFESVSNKKTISQEIERLCDDNDSSKLGYEQVINVLDSYDPDGETPKHHRVIKFRKRQIVYWSVAAIVIVSLLIGIIVVATRL